MQKLELIPIFQQEAFVFVDKMHRHHKRPIGSVFCLAAAIEHKIVGVCVVGRPVARNHQDGYTLEVTRLASDGTKNVCSFLYGAAWRAARSLGYKRLFTYILDDEPGTSLRASGWKELGKRGGGSWNTKSRPRVDRHPLQQKILFIKE